MPMIGRIMHPYTKERRTLCDVIDRYGNLDTLVNISTQLGDRPGALPSIVT